MGSINGLEEDIIERIKDKDDPRKLFTVPTSLCLDDVNFDRLTELASINGVKNHLGYLLDLFIKQNIITLDNNRYQTLIYLRDQLFNDLPLNDIPFYEGQAPEVLAFNVRRRSELLAKWRLIGVIDETKLLEVYLQEYASRQESTA